MKLSMKMTQVSGQFGQVSREMARKMQAIFQLKSKAILQRITEF